MEFRMYEAGDAPSLIRFYKEQGVAEVADLPLPGQDPSVWFAMVGEEGGKARVGCILRLTAEAHLILDPELPDGAQRVLELQQRVLGGAQALSQEMRKLVGVGISDLIAFVPKSKSRMEKMMEVLGFRKEPDSFVPYWLKLSNSRRRQSNG